MSLEDANVARKEKLLALRKRKAQHELSDANEGVTETRSEVFRFRNYDPETGAPRKYDPAADNDDTVERQVQGIAEQAIAEDEERRRQDLDLFNVQPKERNHDLKRDIEKKLAKLEPQTRSAIATLIRKRIQEQRSRQGQTGQDSADMLARATQAQDLDDQLEDVSDDES